MALLNPVDDVILKAVKMPPNKQEPSRLELYKAGKLDERRSARSAHVPDVKKVAIDPDDGQMNISPTAIVIALMVIVLLVLTATSI
jgi:ABC-type oligopeptide transport system substrate-binding subunit